jgi:hypothetical protein
MNPILRKTMAGALALSLAATSLVAVAQPASAASLSVSIIDQGRSDSSEIYQAVATDGQAPYTYMWSLLWEEDFASDNPVAIDLSCAAQQKWGSFLAVQVTDALGSQTTAGITLPACIAAPPIVVTASITSGPTYSGIYAGHYSTVTYSFAASVSGGGGEYTYAWYNNGNLTTPFSSVANPTVSIPCSSLAAWREVTLDVTDQYGQRPPSPGPAAIDLVTSCPRAEGPVGTIDFTLSTNSPANGDAVTLTPTGDYTILGPSETVCFYDLAIYVHPVVSHYPWDRYSWLNYETALQTSSDDPAVAGDVLSAVFSAISVPVAGKCPAWTFTLPDINRVVDAGGQPVVVSAMVKAYDRNFGDPWLGAFDGEIGSPWHSMTYQSLAPSTSGASSNLPAIMALLDNAGPTTGQSATATFLPLGFAASGPNSQVGDPAVWAEGDSGNYGRWDAPASSLSISATQENGGTFFGARIAVEGTYADLGPFVFSAGIAAVNPGDIPPGPTPTFQVTVSAGQATGGDPATFSPSARVENGVLPYAYTWGTTASGGTITWTNQTSATPSVTIPCADLSDGTESVTLTVTDANGSVASGASGPGELVCPPPPPLKVSIAITNETSGGPATFSLAAQIDGVETGVLPYTYAWGIDTYGDLLSARPATWANQTSATPSVTIPCQDLSGVFESITLTVTDARGSVASTKTPGFVDCLPVSYPVDFALSTTTPTTGAAVTLTPTGDYANPGDVVDCYYQVEMTSWHGRGMAVAFKAATLAVDGVCPAWTFTLPNLDNVVDTHGLSSVVLLSFSVKNKTQNGDGEIPDALKSNPEWVSTHSLTYAPSANIPVASSNLPTIMETTDNTKPTIDQRPIITPLFLGFDVSGSNAMVDNPVIEGSLVPPSLEGTRIDPIQGIQRDQSGHAQGDAAFGPFSIIQGELGTCATESQATGSNGSYGYGWSAFPTGWGGLEWLEASLSSANFIGFTLCQSTYTDSGQPVPPSPSPSPSPSPEPSTSPSLSPSPSASPSPSPSLSPSPSPSPEPSASPSLSPGPSHRVPSPSAMPDTSTGPAHSGGNSSLPIILLGLSLLFLGFAITVDRRRGFYR